MYTDFNMFSLFEQEIYGASKQDYACHLTFVL